MDEKIHLASRGKCERACHQAENIEKKLQYTGATEKLRFDWMM
jgi:hypothetical protein